MTQYQIDLKNLPNQEFSVDMENISYTITIQYIENEVSGIMMFSLLIDDTEICTSVPCFANQAILPYPWQVALANGNFVFLTDNENYPHYEDFGNTCNLYFVTKDEIDNG